MMDMNDQPVPNLQDVRGWSVWINQQHTLWHRSCGRQCQVMTPGTRPISCTRTWLGNREHVLLVAMPCQASIKAAETLCRALDLQHVRVGPKLYNRQRTFQSEWRTGNARYQSAVSQEHDAGRQPILRLPRHDAKYFTYRTWVLHQWVNRSPTYRVVQDNAMGYGKKPIIRSTRAQCWTPAGGATARHQAFDLHNVRVAPMNEFSTHQSRQGDARRQS